MNHAQQTSEISLGTVFTSRLRRRRSAEDLGCVSRASFLSCPENARDLARKRFNVEVAREAKSGGFRLGFEIKFCVMACRRRWAAILVMAVCGKNLRWIPDTGMGIGSHALG